MKPHLQNVPKLRNVLGHLWNGIWIIRVKQLWCLCPHDHKDNDQEPSNWWEQWNVEGIYVECQHPCLGILLRKHKPYKFPTPEIYTINLLVDWVNAASWVFNFINGYFYLLWYRNWSYWSWIRQGNDDVAIFDVLRPIVLLGDKIPVIIRRGEVIIGLPDIISLIEIRNAHLEVWLFVFIVRRHI